MFKRILLFTGICLLFVPVICAAEWNMEPTLSVAYVAQGEIDEQGEDVTEFTVAGLTGIEFWRHRDAKTLGWGFSIDLAAVSDEEQTTPRIIPGGALHLGTHKYQGFVGALYDPQDENGVVMMVGMTTAF